MFASLEQVSAPAAPPRELAGIAALARDVFPPTHGFVGRQRRMRRRKRRMRMDEEEEEKDEEAILWLSEPTHKCIQVLHEGLCAMAATES